MYRRPRNNEPLPITERIVLDETTLTNFNENMIKAGLLPSSRLLTFDIVGANEEVADKLNILMGTPVYLLSRLLSGNNQPLAYQVMYRPVSVTPSLSKKDFETTSTVEQLELYGIPVSYATETVDAILADPGTVELLKLLEFAPLLLVKKVVYDENNVPVEYTKSYYNGNKFTLNLVTDRKIWL